MAVKSSDPIDILLEMGIDLDNLSEEEDYLSALKEAIATIQFQTKGGGDERSAILSQEVIKVRKSRKAADPKFKAKKTTIKPDAFFDKKKSDEQQKPVPGQKALPGTVGGGVIAKSKQVKPSDIKKPEKEEEKDTKLLPGGDILKDILGGVNSILGTLQNQNKFTKKQSEKDRKSAEKKKRGTQEDKLEKGPLKKFASGAKKLLKPVTNFFAEVLKFIVTVLIGRLLVKIIKWMGDPANEKKMKAIQDFFMATWPAFLAVFLAFSLGLGGFITSIIGLVGGFALKIAKLVPMMLKGLTTLAMGNPIATAVVAGTALAAVGAIAPMVAPQTVEDDADKQANKAVDEKGTKKAAADIRQQNADRGFFGKIGDVFTGAGQEREEQAQRIEGKPEKRYGFFGEVKPKGMKDGGQVPGSGPNKDTVPAMLAPGEFVMSRGAVSKYGADTMESMNAMGGGTNRPMIKDGVTYAQGGGFAGSKNRPEKSTAKQDMGDRGEESSSNDGGFLGGIKRMFGFGGNNKEKGNEEKASGSTLSKIQQEALQVLAKYESGAAGYDAVNQIGTKGGRGVEGFSGDIKKMPQHEGRSLTDFTLGEIKELQRDDGSMSNSQWIKAGKLHAVGAYQFIGNTLPEVAARAGIPDTAKFSPAVQDLMALQLIKERGISPWVGPSDKATADERAIVEQARSEPIAYDKTSGGGAITAFGGGGGGSYTPPGQSGGGSGGGKSSGDSKGGMSDLFSGYKTIGKVNAGPSLLDLYNEQEKFAGRPEGFKPGGLKFKKPPSSTSDLENNSRTTTNMQQKGAEGAGGMSNQSNASPNPAALNVAPSNDLPEIDANAMISQEKIKVLGITVV